MSDARRGHFERVCPCGLNLDIWQNDWNHQAGCPMRPVEQTNDDPRRGFLPLLVPVEGHAVACQACGALVLDNPNAIRAHRRSHGASS